MCVYVSRLLPNQTCLILIVLLINNNNMQGL